MIRAVSQLVKIIFLILLITSASCQFSEADISDMDEDQLQEIRTAKSALEISENDPLGIAETPITDLDPPEPSDPSFRSSRAKKPNFWCTTDDVPEPAAAAASDAVPTPPYQAVLFADESELGNAPPFPSNLRGGPIPDFPPDPAMGLLLSDYRAQGCDRSERASDHACYSHPYRRALEEEYAHPERTFEQASAYYAPNPQ